MRKRRKIDYHEFDTPPQEEFPGISGVASATELTGMSHRAPVSRAEWENLRELSPMEAPSGEARSGEPGKNPAKSGDRGAGKDR